MKRRKFIKTTGCSGAATMLFPPVFNFVQNIGEEYFPNISALNTRLGVKYVIHGVIHEGAWEGPCRDGELKDLTYEAEKNRLDKALQDFKGKIDKMNFFPGLKTLEPIKTHVWIERGNPELMFPQESIDALAKDDPNTDVYVLYNCMGKPGLAAINIAERFNKPVIIATASGWGVAIPAALRAIKHEGYYVQNDEELKDLLNLLFVRKAISNMKVLNVTDFPESRDRIGVAKYMDMDFLKEKYSIDYQYVGYDEFFEVMYKNESDKKTSDIVNEIGKKIYDGAKGSNMNLEDVKNSVRFYVTAQQFMEKYSCNAFTIDCPELCSSVISWDKRFTPCLTNAMFKDIGYPAACEGDIPALLSMAVQMYLSRKAVYMGNAQLDTNEDTLNVWHSVASLKMLGLDQPDSDYKIEAFTYAKFGVTLRHDFMENYGKPMTVARFDPSGNKLLVTKGDIIDGNTIGCSCAQSVKLKISNSKLFLEKQQDYGNHLTLVYGDCTDSIVGLGKIMGFEVELVS